MAKKKEMNRTSGTARRLLGRSEGIATKLKYGAPLTGSASGVKSISLKDVGETLTQGAFSVGRKGLKADPVNLAMAVIPGSKLGKIGRALTPKSARIAGAAARIASEARRAGAGRADVLNAARGRAAAATDGIRQAGMGAFSDFTKMERRIGTASAEAYYGVAGRSARSSAMDSAGRIADKAGVAEHKARIAASRTKNLADYEFAAREVAGRLKNLKRKGK